MGKGAEISFGGARNGDFHAIHRSAPYAAAAGLKRGSMTLPRGSKTDLARDIVAHLAAALGD
jgi:hypothetical protein